MFYMNGEAVPFPRARARRRSAGRREEARGTRARATRILGYGGARVVPAGLRARGRKIMSEQASDKRAEPNYKQISASESLEAIGEVIAVAER